MDQDDETAVKYLQRAEEVRVIAEGTTDKEARKIVLTVAKDYVRMAETLRRIANSERNRLSRNSN